jgi:hypothetical protein
MVIRLSQRLQLAASFAFLLFEVAIFEHPLLVPRIRMLILILICYLVELRFKKRQLRMRSDKHFRLGCLLISRVSPLFVDSLHCSRTLY